MAWRELGGAGGMSRWRNAAPLALAAAFQQQQNPPAAAAAPDQSAYAAADVAATADGMLRVLLLLADRQLLAVVGVSGDPTVGPRSGKRTRTVTPCRGFRASRFPCRRRLAVHTLRVGSNRSSALPATRLATALGAVRFQRPTACVSPPADGPCPVAQETAARLCCGWRMAAPCRCQQGAPCSTPHSSQAQQVWRRRHHVLTTNPRSRSARCRAGRPCTCNIEKPFRWCHVFRTCASTAVTAGSLRTLVTAFPFPPKRFRGALQVLS